MKYNAMKAFQGSKAAARKKEFELRQQMREDVAVEVNKDRELTAEEDLTQAINKCGGQ